MTMITWDPIQEALVERKARKPLNDIACTPLSRLRLAMVREDIAITISPSARNITITMQLPSVAPSDVAVTIARRTLTVTAEWQREQADQPGRWSLGSAFTWSMLLPNRIDGRNMKASLQHNVLRVFLPHLISARDLADTFHNVGDHPRVGGEIDCLL